MILIISWEIRIVIRILIYYSLRILNQKDSFLTTTRKKYFFLENKEAINCTLVRVVRNV